MVIEVRITVNGAEQVYIIRDGTNIGHHYYISNGNGLRIAQGLQTQEDAFRFIMKLVEKTR